MLVKSLQKNDCAIVALTHYFGIDYHCVINELQGYADKLGIKWHREKGTPQALINAFCYARGLNKVVKIPRRGQDKLTGIVTLYNNNKTQYHCVAMIDGNVFDLVAPEGMHISEYRSRVNCNHI